jgi:hypothetical protein
MIGSRRQQRQQRNHLCCAQGCNRVTASSSQPICRACWGLVPAAIKQRIATATSDVERYAALGDAVRALSERAHDPKTTCASR